MWDFHKLAVFFTNNNHADSNLEIKETIIFKQGVFELITHGWQFILSSRHELYNFTFTHCTSNSKFKVMQMNVMNCLGISRTQTSQACIHSHLM